MVDKKEEDVLLGKRIKEIRVNLKQDQKTFSEKIGSTVSALSNWENGRNKPNDIMLAEIAKQGNTTVEKLTSFNPEDDYLLLFRKHTQGMDETKIKKFNSSLDKLMDAAKDLIDDDDWD